MNERINERTNDRANERTIERTNERTNEWTNERMNTILDKYVSTCTNTLKALRSHQLHLRPQVFGNVKNVNT